MKEEFDYKYNKVVPKNPFVSEPNDPPKGQLAYKSEPAICMKCIFFHTGQSRYLCIAKIRKATNFVTGKEKLKGYRNCTDVNTDGKCPDYKEKKE